MSATIVAPTTSPAQAQHTRRVVAVLPSVGAGGGIEQYVRGVLELLPADTDVVRVAPEGGFRGRAKLRFALHVIRQVRAASMDVTVFVFHPSFLPLVSFAAGRRPRNRTVVFFYGAEIWSASALRRMLWRALPYAPVTISSYSAGALGAISGRHAVFLPPPVPSAWYDRLRSIERPIHSPDSPIVILSVFRLSAAEEKGARTLVHAVDALRQDGHIVELRLAGNGPRSATVDELSEGRPWMHVIESPNEATLAEEYRNADIFALATRTRFSTTEASGEGFGIVLVEAALAGLPVIGPFSGGGRDAMLDGFTGLTPADESSYALTQSIRSLLDQSVRRELGNRGRVWAVERFGPTGRRQLAQIVSTIAGETRNSH